ncbi:uncharacterized protein LOC21404976 [Morus notabilis]|uniref:uncharacterized protein LOC21404976 n=1 Tax=Morus notabilis TaxID=981085 RepID=UPI000CED0839|nr:uncharacterized protein LOC21404976 [Morus notabilis]
MSFASLDLLTNSPPRFTLYFAANPPKNHHTLLPLRIASRHFASRSHFHISNRQLPSPCCSNSPRTHRFRLGVFESEGPVRRDGDLDFDSFLSIVETLCVFSSAVVSLGFAVNCVVSSSKKTVMAAAMGNGILSCGMLVMVAGLGIGAWIRRRQWRRFCSGSVRGGLEVNLLERVEKLEEDLRNSATLIRVISRQLEKLGIRFRVTRKALKEPLAETAALAQKNSEATRALAVQEDILEKELGEIQKVLLAMQEQQQKQLELILAIGKTGKLFETRPERSQEQERIEIHDSTAESLKQKESHQV